MICIFNEITWLCSKLDRVTVKVIVHKPYPAYFKVKGHKCYLQLWKQI